jgi:DNA-binding GntR family transcriptional regulator
VYPIVKRVDTLKRPKHRIHWIISGMPLLASGALDILVSDRRESLMGTKPTVSEADRAPSPDGSERLLSERISDEIRRAVVAGELAPGSRVRQEELALRFGASRIPVREALRRLESEGLVTLVPNSGAWIAKVDVAECIEMYKIRERLETLALSESVPRLGEGDVQTLQRLAAAIEGTTEVEEFLRLDRDLHLLSYSRAEMPRLLDMIERFWNATQHYRRAYFKLIERSGHWIIHAEHRLMMEAIARKDGEEAARILQGHIRRTRLSLEKTIE